MCWKDSIINMKYIIGLMFCGLLAVGNGYYCDSEEECELDECCVAYYAVNFLGLGSCVKKARVGAPCNDEDAKLTFYGGKYLSKCPCNDGLICIAKLTSGTRIELDASQRCVRNFILYGKNKHSNSTQVKTGTDKHQ